jgi:hypothetical protein
MTKTATVTEAQISRAIRAAHKNGLRIKAINPSDGTIVVESDAITSEQERAKQDPYAD